jgi:hypothetical protein
MPRECLKVPLSSNLDLRDSVLPLQRGVDPPNYGRMWKVLALFQKKRWKVDVKVKHRRFRVGHVIVQF